MTIYIFDVFITGFLSMFVIKEFDDNGIETQESKRRKVICLSLILLTWVLIFSFRGVTGGDSSVYRYYYKQAYYQKMSFSEVFEGHRDPLLQVVVYVGSRFFNGSWIVYGVITGIICYVPIILLISKKSEDINTSCLIYLLSLNALYGYNGLKQALASGFIVCAYYFGLREKKYIRYILLIAIAYGFHAATLLVFPFHLISLKKIKTLSTKIILFGLFVLTFLLDDFWPIILNFFGQDDLVSKYSDMFSNAHGSGILRVFVWIAPLVLCCFLYKRLSEKYEDVDHDILMVLFGAIFMIYSMLNANFSQMAYFFSISNIILYPKIISVVNPQYKRLTKYLIISLFFIYFVILLWNGEALISPYISVWESKTF